MRFLHTSDWHLGLTFRGGVSYADDQIYAIKNILKIASDEKADGILLSGDIFDKSVASSEAIHIYDEVMTEICVTMGIPVYAIAGNHDGAERISQCSELLKKSGLYIAGALEEKPVVINNGDTDIYLLPWISTDKAISVFPEKADEIRSLEDAYGVVLDTFRSSFIKGHKNILVAHAFIVNAETSVSDRAAEVGKASMIGSHVFKGFDYVALGHLHGPQKINDKIRYSGSPVPYSFGKEETQQKSVTIIDTDTWEQKVIPLPQLHKRSTLKGSFEELMRADYEDDILKGYVKLEVTDSFIGMDSIAAFRERYANLLEISGKDIEKDDVSITMTVEEFEHADTDPQSVFSQYCKDMLEEEPNEHLKDLFAEALSEFEKEEINR
ncbi:MAG: exonuclease SbcCD subunit D [Lachnospiraceae bacterium]|nr:exonuclease SbcCD subunit D [Lachnospiraceae bacterium]